MMEEDAGDTSPSGESRSILVSGLRRPWKIGALVEILRRFGEVEGMWVNPLRSVCVATFSTSAGASVAATELEGLVWPIGGGALSASLSSQTAAQLVESAASEVPATAATSNKRSRQQPASALHETAADGVWSPAPQRAPILTKRKALAVAAISRHQPHQAAEADAVAAASIPEALEPEDAIVGSVHESELAPPVEPASEVVAWTWRQTAVEPRLWYHAASDRIGPGPLRQGVAIVLDNATPEGRWYLSRQRRSAHGESAPIEAAQDVDAVASRVSATDGLGCGDSREGTDLLVGAAGSAGSGDAHPTPEDGAVRGYSEPAKPTDLVACAARPGQLNAPPPVYLRAAEGSLLGAYRPRLVAGATETLGRSAMPAGAAIQLESSLEWSGGQQRSASLSDAVPTASTWPQQQLSHESEPWLYSAPQWEGRDGDRRETHEPPPYHLSGVNAQLYAPLRHAMVSEPVQQQPDSFLDLQRLREPPLHESHKQLHQPRLAADEPAQWPQQRDRLLSQHGSWAPQPQWPREALNTHHNRTGMVIPAPPGARADTRFDPHHRETGTSRLQVPIGSREAAFPAGKWDDEPPPHLYPTPLIEALPRLQNRASSDIGERSNAYPPRSVHVAPAMPGNGAIAPEGIPRFCLHHLFGICTHVGSHGTCHADGATMADFAAVRQPYRAAKVCCYYLMAGQPGCDVSSGGSRCTFAHPPELRGVETPWDRYRARVAAWAAPSSADSVYRR